MRRISVTPMPGEGNNVNLPVNENTDEQNQQENSIAGNDNELYKVFHPILSILKICGLYFLDGADIRTNCICRFWFGYSTVVLMLLWGHTGLNLANFTFTNRDEFIMRGALKMWDVYISCQASVLFVKCLRKKSWTQFFASYEDTQKGVWPIEGQRHVKSRIHLYVIVSLALVVLLMILNIFLLFWTSMFQYFLLSLASNNSQLLVFKLLYLLILTYQTAAWMIPVIISVLISDFLATSFKCFNKRLAEHSQKCPKDFCESLGQVRDMHHKLSKLTSAADELLSEMAGITIVFNVAIDCCLMYSLLHEPFSFKNPLMVISQIFWLASAVVIIFVSTGCYAWVSEKVSLMEYIS